VETSLNSQYNASWGVKATVVAGTALASGAYIAHAMKTRNLKKLSQLELGIREGIELCTASTLGGLATGLLVDKPENRKAKLKDGVNQLVGNTFIPFGFLALANLCTKKLPKVVQSIVAVGALIGTTFLGHNVADKINEKLFKEKSGYKCTFKDFATDFDDVIFATSTVLKSKKLYQMTAAICPITYLTHGYLAGTRQEERRLDKYV
jgi:hypothetical protein